MIIKPYKDNQFQPCRGCAHRDNTGFCMECVMFSDAIERMTMRKALENMAKYISARDIDEDICRPASAGLKDCELEGRNCTDCIIGFFTPDGDGDWGVGTKHEKQ